MENNKRIRVGVITKHRVVNYGSFLQTYATQQVFNRLGYDCEIIDYQYPNAIHKKKKPKKKWIDIFVKAPIRLIINPFRFNLDEIKEMQVEKVRMCSDYISRYINLSSKHYSTKEEIEKDQPYYDIYVTGSDQTWNPTHMMGDPVFMLSFAPEGAKKIAFSASMCKADIPTELQPIYSKYLSQYSKISMRESASSKQIEALSGIVPKMTLDPTLFLSDQEWLSTFPINKFKGENYILLYLLSYSFNPRPYIYELIQKLQSKTGLEVFVLGGDFKDQAKRGYRNVNNANMDDFISLFANASYVVTSSFHGTAFAVNFNIPLYSVVPESSHDNRQSDFLKQVDCHDYIFPLGTPFRFIEKPLDRSKLIIVRKESIEILKDMLDD